MTHDPILRVNMSQPSDCLCGSIWQAGMIRGMDERSPESPSYQTDWGRILIVLLVAIVGYVLVKFY